MVQFCNPFVTGPNGIHHFVYPGAPAKLYQRIPGDAAFNPHFETSGDNHGNIVKVAGLILIRQRPGTAKGVCFITIEDETGTSNLVIFSKLFDKYRLEIVQSKMLIVEGQVQKEGQIIHIVVRKCYDGSRLLKKLNNVDLNLKPMPRGDETTSLNSNPKPLPLFKGRYFRVGGILSRGYI